MITILLYLLHLSLGLELDVAREAYDTSDVVKVIDMKSREEKEWRESGLSSKLLIATAIQFRWLLTTADSLVVSSAGFWDFPTKLVDKNDLRVLSLNGSWFITFSRTSRVIDIYIHPNFQLRRIAEYNTALIKTEKHVSRTVTFYYSIPWNFYMMEPAYILGLNGSRMRKIFVRMDHGLHECPCFIRQQAFTAVCLFDLERRTHDCDFIGGSPLFLKRTEMSGLMIGYTDAYYLLDDCAYSVFKGTMCVNRRSFFSAVTICSLFNFLNNTLGRSFRDDLVCSSTMNLPFITLTAALIFICFF